MPVTKVVERRSPVLMKAAIASELVGSWQFLRQQGRIKLFAYCVMPDHYHLAFCLMPEEDLSRLMESTNKYTAAQINRLLKRRGRFWQEGFRDQNCRNRAELHELCEYIEHNPVRAGLVGSAAEWSFSSASVEGQGNLDRGWWPQSASERPPTSRRDGFLPSWLHLIAPVAWPTTAARCGTPSVPTSPCPARGLFS